MVCSLGLRHESDLGIFAVPKKSGKQLLVVDARRASLHFRAPELEIQPGETLHCAVALRGFLSLPAVEKWELGITSVEGVPIDDTTPIFPQFRVMPMEWTHALTLCLHVLSAYVVDFATIGTNAA